MLAFECFQIFARLYVSRQNSKFLVQKTYALITKANLIDCRNMKIKSVLTTNISISHPLSKNFVHNERVY